MPWTTQQTFRGVLLTIFPWVALALALNYLGGSSSSSASSGPLSPQADLIGAIVAIIFTALIEGAFLIAPLYYANVTQRNLAQRGRAALRALGFRGFPVGRTIFWIVVLMLLILGVNILYQVIISTFHLNIQTNDQVILANSKNAPLTTYGTLFAAVFIAPFCEEIFFRGFLFPGLLRGMPLGWAIAISALLFAVAHADPGSFVVLVTIGVAFAFLRWRTQSIWPGMILHMLNNAIGALAIILAMNGVTR